MARINYRFSSDERKPRGTTQFQPRERPIHISGGFLREEIQQAPKDFVGESKEFERNCSGTMRIARCGSLQQLISQGESFGLDLPTLDFCDHTSKLSGSGWPTISRLEGDSNVGAPSAKARARNAASGSRANRERIASA
jgi:hypothetical protein